MHQVWHIFKKDLLHLWREVALYLVAAVVLCGFGGHTFPAEASWAMYEGPVMTLVTALLVARLIHAEALAGDRQFWITRPYRWTCLLGAKMLFMVALIHLPVLLIQWLVVFSDGFPFSAVWPGLLSEQVLLLGVTLFMAALAALTEGLISFVIAGLCLTALRMGIAQHSLRSMEWIRSLLLLISMLSLAAVVLYLQYRVRRTLRSRLVAVSFLAAGVAMYILVPWKLAFAIQERFSKQHYDPSSLSVTLDAGSGRFGLSAGKEKRVPVILPLKLQGFPSGTVINPEALEMTLRAADGRDSRAFSSLARSTETEINSGFAVLGNADVDRSFFEAERDHPVTLRGTLYLTVFGNDRLIPVLYHTPTAVTESLRCSFSLLGVICDAPFRWPNQLVTAVPARGHKRPLSYLPSYSPVPAVLSYYPIDRRFAPGVFPESGDAPPVIEVTDPLAYVRRDFEIRDVRLIDIAVPWRSQWVSRNGKSVLESEY